MIVTCNIWRKPVIPQEVCVAPLLAMAMLGIDHTCFAYTPGTITTRAQPIIDMLRELAGPCAYGVFLWACIRRIMNQSPEAKEMMKNCAWGYLGVQLAPVFMDMIRDVR